MSMQNFPVNWMGRGGGGDTPHAAGLAVLGSLRDQRQSPRERASPCWLRSVVILSTRAILVSDKKHASLEGLPYNGRILNWLEN